MSPPNSAPQVRIGLATWLTIGRMGLVIPAALCIHLNYAHAAFLTLALAGLTDFLDGYVARRRGEVTPLGTVLDPIADKVLTLSVLLAFVGHQTIQGVHLIPVYAIFLREPLVSGLRESAATHGGLSVTGLAKTKTTLQFLALLALCYGPSPLALGLLWVASLLTVWTGILYIKRWLTIAL